VPGSDVSVNRGSETLLEANELLADGERPSTVYFVFMLWIEYFTFSQDDDSIYFITGGDKASQSQPSREVSNPAKYCEDE
jgi:hypothetical protein